MSKSEIAKYFYLTAFWILAPISAALSWMSCALGEFVVKMHERSE